MKMRRDWANIPDKNRHELERMLSALATEFEFDLAILYGRYAGGRMRSERGGYELLLLTRGNPTHEGWELEKYLSRRFPVRSRVERRLHVETAGVHTFNNVNTASWFFLNIRTESTIVYDSGRAAQGVFRSTRLKRVKACKFARRQYDHFFTNGSAMLDDAERLWSEKKPSLAALQLSCAALFLLRAEETVFYGNAIQAPNLQTVFRRASLFSRKLIGTFRTDDTPASAFFEQLTELRHAPCEQTDFVLPKWRYRMLLIKLRTMQDIVRSSCERHLFYLEHGKTKSQAEAEERAAAADVPTEHDPNIGL